MQPAQESRVVLSPQGSVLMGQMRKSVATLLSFSQLVRSKPDSAVAVL